MKNLLCAVVFLALFSFLASCSHNVREDLDQTVVKYNDLVRWNEMGAASMFMPERLRDDFLARANSMGNVRLIDYKIINVRYDEIQKKARVDVSIEYYLLSNYKAKKILATEEWAFVEEHGVKGWMLMSPMPEMK
ncbi:MAG TPA: hypothetical protein VMB78_10690 [Dissulfurispiraceae bacterium]|nr:hypothetical protein [Dissulfurispiraceae bacterium]